MSAYRDDEEAARLREQVLANERRLRDLSILGAARPRATQPVERPMPVGRKILTIAIVIAGLLVLGVIRNALNEPDPPSAPTFRLSPEAIDRLNQLAPK